MSIPRIVGRIRYSIVSISKLSFYQIKLDDLFSIVSSYRYLKHCGQLSDSIMKRNNEKCGAKIKEELFKKTNKLK